jgi:hypothetical protein
MTKTDSVLARFGFLLLPVFIAGSGAHSNLDGHCPTPAPTLVVSPPSATVDHGAAPPGNSEQFTATFEYLHVPPGCAISNVQPKLTNVIWSLSDSTNATISNAQDSTYGVATCTGASASTITVTATLSGTPPGAPNTTATSTLICK